MARRNRRHARRRTGFFQSLFQLNWLWSATRPRHTPSFLPPPRLAPDYAPDWSAIDYRKLRVSAVFARRYQVAAGVAPIAHARRLYCGAPTISAATRPSGSARRRSTTAATERVSKRRRLELMTSWTTWLELVEEQHRQRV